MNSTKRFVLFYILFGQLIADNNRDEELSKIVNDLPLHFNSSAIPSNPEERNGYSSTIFNQILNQSKLLLDEDIGKKLFKNGTTLGPLCSPFDSCQSRCGEVSRDFRHSCSCNSNCAIYSDCCVDFERECRVESAEQSNQLYATSNVNVTCEMMFDRYPVLMVSKCSPQYQDTLTTELCSQKLPSECFLPNLVFENESGDASSCKNFVFALCSEQLHAKCNNTLEVSCSKLIFTVCTKMASQKCQMCAKSFWPVLDANGTVYRNSYCAKCNYLDNYINPKFRTYLDIFQSPSPNAFINSKTSFRVCFPSTTDYCDGKEDLSIPCKSTSGPVSLNTVQHDYNVVYKNIYCAICNNATLSDLKCASLWPDDSMQHSLVKSVVNPLIEDFVNVLSADIDILRLEDIPATFSMLLNFGLAGRRRVYISSEGNDAMKQHQKKCGSGNIWDPFSNVCRKLHCNTDFALVDYQCVKKESHEEDRAMNDTDPIVTCPEYDFVHLSFSAEMEFLDILQIYKQDIEVICESIRESFSTSFNINIDRITNVKFNISVGDSESLEEMLDIINIMDENHLINITISLDLYENSGQTESEPSVDSIVSLLASSLSVNGLEFGISNKTSRIYEIHQSSEFLTSWCNSEDGGEKINYSNSDFRLILNEDSSSSTSEKIKGIYINKTGKFYSKGEFVANILYQGYQFNQNLINVSGVAIVCDWKIRLNDSCPRLHLNKSEYSIAEDGSLLIPNASLRGIAVDLNVYEDTGDGVVVCLRSNMYFLSDETYALKFDVIQGYLTYILSWISISAMLVVLITYSLFPSLRNLPGCNTMNLTFSLTAMQITFILGQRDGVIGNECKIVAWILHFELLACFMWMNVMAYDLYKTFGTKTIMNNIRSTRKYLPRYMAYAYGIPLIFVVITSLLDHFLEDSRFAPHYGMQNICWITSKHSAAAFFALPLATIMCINSGFFMYTIYSIRSVKHVLYMADEKSKQRGKSDVFLYARMALVIGLTWALAFAAAYSKQDSVTGKILTYLFIIFNTLQGLFLFCVFVCNRRVYALYREALHKLSKKMSNNSSNEKCMRTFPRLTNAMHRTVSSDTVVSIVSSSSSCSSDSNLQTIKEVE
ncbi:hypothetical protein JTE90_028518 [Oedothorax gibbosus]|uniref:Uncharacterized protein n=1 Tax=Oedothorax gibbosus TaxID=931172 RepID=A0AAV6VXR3_9ARAC|nr:hypothetical protein JTE90_028518 [Oedothorax gibbosus]